MTKPTKKDEKETEKIILEVPKAPRKRRGQPVATQHHQVLTTYTKELSLEELENQTNGDDESENTDASETEGDEEGFESLDETGDPNEAFLREVETTHANWQMRVFILPNFDVDGRSDPQAPGRARVATLPFHYLTFEDDVALHCARPTWSNNFSIEVLKDGRFKRRLPPRKIHPAPAIEYQRLNLTLPEWYQTAAPSTINAAVNPQASIDPFASMQPALDTMSKMMKMFGIQPGTMPQSQNALPHDDGLSAEERAIAVMLGRNEKIQERLANGLASKLFGEGVAETSGTSWMDLAKTFLETAPAIIAGFAQFAPSLATPQPIQTAPPAQPVQTVEQIQPPIELVFLDGLVRACAGKMPTNAARAMIFSFEEQHPTVTPYLEAFMQMSASDAIGFCTAIIPPSSEVFQQPHAEKWISDLQEALKADESTGNDA